MNFIALDLETANSCQSSICQIGMVQVTNSIVTSTCESYVDPEDDFNQNNIAIHGIEKEDVKFAPSFRLFYDTLAEKLNGNKILHHTAHVRIAIDEACDKHNFPRLDVEWIDSSEIVKKALPQFSEVGYGLKNVANHFGYKFKHHDALNDALATAFITIQCLEILEKENIKIFE